MKYFAKAEKITKITENGYTEKNRKELEMKKLTTKEQISKSLSDFLLKNEVSKDASLVDTYNKWSLTENVIIESNDLVEWATKCLHDMIGIDPALLSEAKSLEN